MHGNPSHWLGVVGSGRTSNVSTGESDREREIQQGIRLRLQHCCCGHDCGHWVIAYFSASRRDDAVATQTGKSCGECHTDPKGGGALTAFGEKFKANGNKLPK
jgi:hypothetical protein